MDGGGAEVLQQVSDGIVNMESENVENTGVFPLGSIYILIYI